LGDGSGDARRVRAVVSGSSRLLVLDDEPAFAAFVAEVGRGLGYDAATTHSAVTFEAAYLAAPPDVIVLDIVMPDRDGIEVVKWLTGIGCRARIVIISGFSPTFAAAAQVIGELHGKLEIRQLTKPVKLAELRAALGEPKRD
jgi:CheY-like chemotaxis protein